jgi:hypothetical protein
VVNPPVGLEHDLGRVADPAAVGLLELLVDVGDLEQLARARSSTALDSTMSGVALASMAAVIFGRNSFNGTIVICRSTLFFCAHSRAKFARASSLSFRN